MNGWRCLVMVLVPVVAVSLFAASAESEPLVESDEQAASSMSAAGKMSFFTCNSWILGFKAVN